jgi:hypothetical protein
MSHLKIPKKFLTEEQKEKLPPEIVDLSTPSYNNVSNSNNSNNLFSPTMISLGNTTIKNGVVYHSGTVNELVVASEGADELGNSPNIAAQVSAMEKAVAARKRVNQNKTITTKALLAVELADEEQRQLDNPSAEDSLDAKQQFLSNPKAAASIHLLIKLSGPTSDIAMFRRAAIGFAQFCLDVEGQNEIVYYNNNSGQAVDTMIRLLTVQDKQVVQNICTAFANISTMVHHRNALIESGLIDVFLQIINIAAYSHNDKQTSTALNTASSISRKSRQIMAFTLANLAFDHVSHGDFTGSIPIILSLVDFPDAELVQWASLLIQNLASNPSLWHILMQSNCLGSIYTVLSDETAWLESWAHCLSTLHSLAIEERNKLMIVEYGFVPLLLKIIQNFTENPVNNAVNNKVLECALGTLANLVAIDETHSYAVNLAILQLILSLLQPKFNINLHNNTDCYYYIMSFLANCTGNIANHTYFAQIPNITTTFIAVIRSTAIFRDPNSDNSAVIGQTNPAQVVPVEILPESSELVVNSVRSLANLSCSEVFHGVLLQNNIVQLLLSLLSQPQHAIIRNYAALTLAILTENSELFDSSGKHGHYNAILINSLFNFMYKNNKSNNTAIAQKGGKHAGNKHAAEDINLDFLRYCLLSLANLSCSSSNHVYYLDYIDNTAQFLSIVTSATDAAIKQYYMLLCANLAANSNNNRLLAQPIYLNAAKQFLLIAPPSASLLSSHSTKHKRKSNKINQNLTESLLAKQFNQAELHTVRCAINFFYNLLTNPVNQNNIFELIMSVLLELLLHNNQNTSNIVNQPVDQLLILSLIIQLLQHNNNNKAKLVKLHTQSLAALIRFLQDCEDAELRQNNMKLISLLCELHEIRSTLTLKPVEILPIILKHLSSTDPLIENFALKSLSYLLLTQEFVDNVGSKTNQQFINFLASAALSSNQNARTIAVEAVGNYSSHQSTKINLTDIDLLKPLLQLGLSYSENHSENGPELLGCLYALANITAHTDNLSNHTRIASLDILLINTINNLLALSTSSAMNQQIKQYTTQFLLNLATSQHQYNLFLDSSLVALLLKIIRLEPANELRYNSIAVLRCISCNARAVKLIIDSDGLQLISKLLLNPPFIFSQDEVEERKRELDEQQELNKSEANNNLGRRIHSELYGLLYNLSYNYPPQLIRSEAPNLSYQPLSVLLETCYNLLLFTTNPSQSRAGFIGLINLFCSAAVGQEINFSTQFHTDLLQKFMNFALNSKEKEAQNLFALSWNKLVQNNSEKSVVPSYSSAAQSKVYYDWCISMLRHNNRNVQIAGLMAFTQFCIHCSKVSPPVQCLQLVQQLFQQCYYEKQMAHRRHSDSDSSAANILINLIIRCITSISGTVENHGLLVDHCSEILSKLLQIFQVADLESQRMLVYCIANLASKNQHAVMELLSNIELNLLISILSCSEFSTQLRAVEAIQALAANETCAQKLLANGHTVEQAVGNDLLSLLSVMLLYEQSTLQLQTAIAGTLFNLSAHKLQEEQLEALINLIGPLIGLANKLSSNFVTLATSQQPSPNSSASKLINLKLKHALLPKNNRLTPSAAAKNSNAQLQQQQTEKLLLTVLRTLANIITAAKTSADMVDATLQPLISNQVPLYAGFIQLLNSPSLASTLLKTELCRVLACVSYIFSSNSSWLSLESINLLKPLSVSIISFAGKQFRKSKRPENEANQSKNDEENQGADSENSDFSAEVASEMLVNVSLFIKLLCGISRFRPILVQNSVILLILRSCYIHIPVDNSNNTSNTAISINLLLTRHTILAFSLYLLLQTAEGYTDALQQIHITTAIKHCINTKLKYSVTAPHNAEPVGNKSGSEDSLFFSCLTSLCVLLEDNNYLVGLSEEHTDLPQLLLDSFPSFISCNSVLSNLFLRIVVRLSENSVFLNCFAEANWLKLLLSVAKQRSENKSVLLLFLTIISRLSLHSAALNEASKAKFAEINLLGFINDLLKQSKSGLIHSYCILILAADSNNYTKAEDEKSAADLSQVSIAQLFQTGPGLTILLETYQLAEKKSKSADKALIHQLLGLTLNKLLSSSSNASYILNQTNGLALCVEIIFNLLKSSKESEMQALLALQTLTNFLLKLNADTGAAIELSVTNEQVLRLLKFIEESPACNGAATATSFQADYLAFLALAVINNLSTFSGNLVTLAACNRQSFAATLLKILSFLPALKPNPLNSIGIAQSNLLSSLLCGDYNYHPYSYTQRLVLQILANCSSSPQFQLDFMENTNINRYMAYLLYYLRREAGAYILPNSAKAKGRANYTISNKCVDPEPDATSFASLAAVILSNLLNSPYCSISKLRRIISNTNSASSGSISARTENNQLVIAHNKSLDVIDFLLQIISSAALSLGLSYTRILAGCLCKITSRTEYEPITLYSNNNNGLLENSMQLMNSEDETIVHYGLVLVTNCIVKSLATMNNSNSITIHAIQLISHYLRLITWPDSKIQFIALSAIKKLLSINSNPNVKSQSAVTDSNGIWPILTSIKQQFQQLNNLSLILNCLYASTLSIQCLAIEIVSQLIYHLPQAFIHNATILTKILPALLFAANSNDLTLQLNASRLVFSLFDDRKPDIRLLISIQAFNPSNESGKEIIEEKSKFESAHSNPPALQLIMKLLNCGNVPLRNRAYTLLREISSYLEYVPLILEAGLIRQLVKLIAEMENNSISINLIPSDQGNGEDLLCKECECLSHYEKQTSNRWSGANSALENDLYYEIVWLLRNCCLNETIHQGFIDQLGVEALIQLLNNKDPNIVRLAISAIKSIIPTALVTSANTDKPNPLLLTRALIQLLTIYTQPVQADNAKNNKTSKSINDEVEEALGNNVLLLTVDGLHRLCVLDSVLSYLVNQTQCIHLLTLLMTNAHVGLLTSILALLLRLLDYNISAQSMGYIQGKLSFLIEQGAAQYGNSELKRLLLNLITLVINYSLQLKRDFARLNGLKLLLNWRAEKDLTMRNNALNALFVCLADENILINESSDSHLTQLLLTLSQVASNQRLRELAANTLAQLDKHQKASRATSPKRFTAKKSPKKATEKVKSAVAASKADIGISDNTADESVAMAEQPVELDSNVKEEEKE